MRRTLSAILLLSGLAAQTAFGQGAKPVIDNARVVVYDIDWASGAPPALPFSKYDCLVVFRTAGQLRKVSAVSPTTVVPKAAGEFMYLEQAAVDKLEAAAGTTPRTMIAFFKDDPQPPLKNESGQPLAFPRPGAKRLINNQRFIIWDYTWTIGQPTPVHFHDKDALVLFLEDGPLTSTTPDGQTVVNDYKAGDIRFNARDRVHSEELKSGKQHAIITEVK